MGITLMEVPYWWDGQSISLATSLHAMRPDLLADYANEYKSSFMTHHSSDLHLLKTTMTIDTVHRNSLAQNLFFSLTSATEAEKWDYRIAK